MVVYVNEHHFLLGVSIRSYMKTSHLRTWVRMAVACVPYSCQMNEDKGVVWESLGGVGCSLEIRTEGFQVTDLGAS